MRINKKMILAIVLAFAMVFCNLGMAVYAASSDRHIWRRDDGFRVYRGNIFNDDTIWIGGVLPDAEGSGLANTAFDAGFISELNDLLRGANMRPLSEQDIAAIRNAIEQGVLIDIAPVTPTRDVPLWYAEARYRNDNARPVTTDGNFARTLQQTFDNNRYMVASGRSFGPGLVGPQFAAPAWPWPTMFNAQLSRDIISAAQQGFANDNIRHAIPFSTEFANRHLNNIDVNVGMREGVIGGFYQGFGSNGRQIIGIGFLPQWRRDNEPIGEAATFAHEWGRALGLGSHLTVTFSSVMTGYDRSRLNYILSYTYVMDNRLKQEMGQVEFLRAVFWGTDEKYAVAWDEHMLPLTGVDFNTMQLARQACYQANVRDNTQVANALHSAGIDTDFTNVTNMFERGNFAQFRNEINRIANVARQQGLQPYQAIVPGRMPMRSIALEPDIITPIPTPVVYIITEPFIPAPPPPTDGISVLVNGSAVDFTIDGISVPPVIVDGRTLVPVRPAAYALGAEVDWDGATRTATLARGDTVIEIVTGSYTFLRNGVEISLDVPAGIINDRNHLPLRALFEAFGAEVSWDEATQTAYISIR